MPILLHHWLFPPYAGSSYSQERFPHSLGPPHLRMPAQYILCVIVVSWWCYKEMEAVPRYNSKVKSCNILHELYGFILVTPSPSKDVLCWEMFNLWMSGKNNLECLIHESNSNVQISIQLSRSCFGIWASFLLNYMCHHLN